MPKLGLQVNEDFTEYRDRNDFPIEQRMNPMAPSPVLSLQFRATPLPALFGPVVWPLKTYNRLFHYNSQVRAVKH